MWIGRQDEASAEKLDDAAAVSGEGHVMVMRGRPDVVEVLKASFGEAVAASQALPAGASMADRIGVHFGPVERALHAANVELARLRRAGHDARAAALEAEIRPVAMEVVRLMDELVREAERPPALAGDQVRVVH